MFTWLAWFPLLLLAVLNGAARDFIYKDKAGELRAHQISTFTLMGLSAIFVYFLNRLWPFRSETQAILLGIIWFIMTIAFEFGFGYFIIKHSWKRLLNDYNIFEGKIWSLFLIFLLFLPWLVHNIFNK